MAGLSIPTDELYLTELGGDYPRSSKEHSDYHHSNKKPSKKEPIIGKPIL
jgi:hypothetical protein